MVQKRLGTTVAIDKEERTKYKKCFRVTQSVGLRLEYHHIAFLEDLRIDRWWHDDRLANGCLMQQ